MDVASSERETDSHIGSHDRWQSQEKEPLEHLLGNVFQALDRLEHRIEEEETPSSTCDYLV